MVAQICAQLINICARGHNIRSLTTERHVSFHRSHNCKSETCLSENRTRIRYVTSLLPQHDHYVYRALSVGRVSPDALRDPENLKLETVEKWDGLDGQVRINMKI